MAQNKLIGIAVLSLAAATAAHASAPHGLTGVVYKPSVAISDLYGNQPNVMVAPEIDPVTAFSGFTLLAGGLAVIRGRRAKK